MHVPVVFANWHTLQDSVHMLSTYLRDMLSRQDNMQTLLLLILNC